MSLGKRIKALRKTLGLSQKEVSEMTSIPQGTISRLEKELIQDVKASILIKLSKGFEVSTSYLLELPPTDLSQLKIISSSAEFSNQDKEEALVLIKTILKKNNQN